MESTQSKENKKAESFKFRHEYINDKQIKYHFLKSDNSRLTYAEFLHLFKEKDEDFLKTFQKTLNHATDKLSAYFWECIPVSSNTINKEFEFVVTGSLTLDIIDQDHSRFKEHIDKTRNNYVTSFSNLGGDSTLIIPTPQKIDDDKEKTIFDSLKLLGQQKIESLDFKNISQFTKNAPEEQQQEFWKEVAEKMSEELEKNNSEDHLWLSTHGLGVSYLHVRIDSFPKYYSFKEYSKYEYWTKEKLISKIRQLEKTEIENWLLKSKIQELEKEKKERKFRESNKEILWKVDNNSEQKVEIEQDSNKIQQAQQLELPKGSINSLT